MIALRIALQHVHKHPESAAPWWSMVEYCRHQAESELQAVLRKGPRTPLGAAVWCHYWHRPLCVSVHLQWMRADRGRPAGLVSTAH